MLNNKNIENEMKLEFVSKSSNEAFARLTVAAFAAQLDPTIEELADIKTAVSEAVTNAIIHGYEKKTGIVRISAWIVENKIIIDTDELCTFNVDGEKLTGNKFIIDVLPKSITLFNDNDFVEKILK